MKKAKKVTIEGEEFIVGKLNAREYLTCQAILIGADGKPDYQKLPDNQQMVVHYGTLNEDGSKRFKTFDEAGDLDIQVFEQLHRAIEEFNTRGNSQGQKS